MCYTTCPDHMSWCLLMSNWKVKVNSVQEACTKCFAVHKLKNEILQITWKNETKNIRPLVFSFSSIDLAWGLQDFKFWYVNHKAFGASVLYWVDITFGIFKETPGYETKLITLDLSTSKKSQWKYFSVMIIFLSFLFYFFWILCR